MSRTFLSKYESYSKICIQCHDNPDADALASGYALFKYYSSKGIETSLIYGGVNRITKPNLKMMCEKLEIPVEFAPTLPECDLLITVDCRYGESNVTHFDAKKVAVIDHHESDRDPDDIDTNAEDHIADETRYRILEIHSASSSGAAVGIG